MAERTVATIKSALRRCMLASPGSRWWEVLPDVARSIRMLVAKGTGLSPYLLTYKQHPELGL